MKKTWWKVPLYCIVASWVGFQLRIQFLGKWARETLPNGSITINDTRWMLGTAVLFLAVVFIGGFFLFRKMTRKEIFCSASVLAAFNLAAGLMSYKTQGMTTIYFAMVTDWGRLVSDLVYQFTQNSWLTTAISWIFLPYIFIPFGKKEVHTGE